MTDPIIEARGVTRRFGDLAAVNGLSFQVRPREIFGLVGPDGAGKTTTLRLLLGLMDPDEGKTLIGGRDVASQPQVVKERIGYMAQRFGLYDDLTVAENMDFYADIYEISRAERDEMDPRLLKITGMAPFLNRRAGKLSGGMRQKLALMCTLLHRPEILILDEPTNGVDPVSRREFWSVLYQLVEGGVTVLLTTAYLDEAERCNRVGLMHEGSMVRCDSPEMLREQFPYICYELEAEAPREARDRLQSLDGVHGVLMFGETLHLMARPDSTSVEGLLQQSGVKSCRPIPPSLEDVFLALLPGEAQRTVVARRRP